MATFIIRDDEFEVHLLRRAPTDRLEHDTGQARLLVVMQE